MAAHLRTRREILATGAALGATLSLGLGSGHTVVAGPRVYPHAARWGGAVARDFGKNPQGRLPSRSARGRAAAGQKSMRGGSPSGGRGARPPPSVDGWGQGTEACEACDLGGEGE